MALDEATSAFLAELAESGAKPLHVMTPEEARQLTAALGELFGPGPEMRRIEDHTVASGDESFPIRVLVPNDSPRAVIVYYHGGGWVIGALDEFDTLGRQLAERTGDAVVLVDYRLAPEHRYPAAADDAWAALTWTQAHLADIAGGPVPLIVAGDSAGGNLAAAVAIACRDEGLPLAAQLLIYPACDLATEYPSYAQNADGYLLTRDDMREAIARYTEGTADRTDPRISPLYTPDLGGLAPAVVAVAEYDPIRDDGVAYAEALEKAGTPVVLRRLDGLIHGFIGFTAASPAADAAMGGLCADLAGLLRSRH